MEPAVALMNDSDEVFGSTYEPHPSSTGDCLDQYQERNTRSATPDATLETSSKQQSSHPDTFALLLLPPEIRQQIWKHVIEASPRLCICLPPNRRDTTWTLDAVAAGAVPVVPGTSVAKDLLEAWLASHRCRHGKEAYSVPGLLRTCRFLRADAWEIWARRRIELGFVKKRDLCLWVRSVGAEEAARVTVFRMASFRNLCNVGRARKCLDQVRLTVLRQGGVLIAPGRLQMRVTQGQIPEGGLVTV